MTLGCGSWTSKAPVEDAAGKRDALGPRRISDELEDQHHILRECMASGVHLRALRLVQADEVVLEALRDLLRNVFPQVDRPHLIGSGVGKGWGGALGLGLGL